MKGQKFFGFPIYLTQEKPGYPFHSEGCKSFSEQFGENARLIITAVEHDDNKLTGHHDILTLQLLNDNGEFNPLAPVFLASTNVENEPETYGVQQINVVDHYQPTFIPAHDPK